jgi:DNA-binding NarL/FixJ family response regulator
MPGDRTRALLVDDHELFRAGLRSLLEAEPDFEVVAEAASARQAYVEDARVGPDLAVIDIRLPGTDGIAATRELKRRDAKRKVVLLSAMADPQLVIDALNAGADGYTLKSQPAVEILAALRAVVDGGQCLPAGVTPEVIEQSRKLARRGGDRSLDLLSSREREIFRLLVRGQTNGKIAQELCISVKTVESHREHIFKKLGAHSIVELVRLAAREHLLGEEAG